MLDAKTKPAKKAARAKALTNIVGSRIGLVESDKRDRTRTVVISFVQKHAKYGKYIRNRTILQAHDESNESHLGDLVEVAPCRPYSKSKNWRVVRIVEKGKKLTVETKNELEA